jgi:hypothetical protein
MAICACTTGIDMTQEASNQLIDKIKVILKGIDQTEIESADGWWETSTGAKLGAEALKQILELLAQTQEPFEDLATELFVVAQISPADDGFSDTIERIESWLQEHFSTPPQRSESFGKPSAWVGLTDEDKHEIELRAGITEDDDGYIVSQVFKLTEAKLKEKNT